MAARTLEKAVLFALPQLILLSQEEVAYTIPHTQKALIFLPALFKISGEHSVKAEHEQRKRYQMQRHKTGKIGGKIKEQRNYEQRKRQLIRAAAPRHEFSKPVHYVSPLLYASIIFSRGASRNMPFFKLL